MGKNWLSRTVYLTFFVAGAALLIWAHIVRHTEHIMLGTALLAISGFFMHWPISWKHGT